MKPIASTAVLFALLQPTALGAAEPTPEKIQSVELSRYATDLEAQDSPAHGCPGFFDAQGESAATC